MISTKRSLTLQDAFKENLFTWNGLIGPFTWVEVVQKLVAEFIGTAILVIIGCWSVGIEKYLPTAGSPHLNISFGFGIAILIIVVIIGHISYANVNPAVTLTFVIIGVIKPGLGLLYAVVQCLGAIAGAALVYALGERFRGDEAKFCCTVLNTSLEIWQGLCIEMTATSILCLVVCGAFDIRCAAYFDSISLKFGFTVMVLALTVGPFTSCSMNPARSLGPAIIANFWENHWVYWVAPLTGSSIAAVLYRFVLFAPKQKEKEDEEVKTVITENTIIEQTEEEKEE